MAEPRIQLPKGMPETQRAEYEAWARSNPAKAYSTYTIEDYNKKKGGDTVGPMAVAAPGKAPQPVQKPQAKAAPVVVEVPEMLRPNSPDFKGQPTPDYLKNTATGQAIAALPSQKIEKGETPRGNVNIRPAIQDGKIIYEADGVTPVLGGDPNLPGKAILAKSREQGLEPGLVRQADGSILKMTSGLAGEPVKPAPKAVAPAGPAVVAKAPEPKPAEKKADAGFNFGDMLKGIGGALGPLAGLVQAYSYGQSGNTTTPLAIDTLAKRRAENEAREQLFEQEMKKSGEEWKQRQAELALQLQNAKDLEGMRQWGQINQMREAQKMAGGGGAVGTPWTGNLDRESAGWSQ